MHFICQQEREKENELYFRKVKSEGAGAEGGPLYLTTERRKKYSMQIVTVIV